MEFLSGLLETSYGEKNDGNTMTKHVTSLVEFHATNNFGSRENLRFHQAKARSAYSDLSRKEQDELAGEAIAQIKNGKSRFGEALCCLACFCPGSLVPFHPMLVEARVIYPGVIFHGASSEIAQQIIDLCEQEDRHDHALVALAWIGNEVVQTAFSNWRKRPPAWKG